MGVHYINKNGDIALTLANFQDASGFSEGLAVVKKANSFCGFINKIGEVVIELIYFYASNFSEGLSIVKTQEKGFLSQPATKWGAIDKNGDLVFEGEYDRIYDFSEGIAIAKKDDNFLLLNNKGENVQTINVNEIHLDSNEVQKFSEGLVVAYDTKTQKYGFINKTGKFVIEPKFENAANFSEELARVSIKEDFREYLGFINPQGEYVIKPYFDIDSDFLRGTTDFSEGLASLLDAPLMMNKAQTFIYIDKTGEIVLRPNFFRAESFSEGLAVVCNENSGNYGYIDKTGNLVIPTKFGFADSFSEGLALVSDY